MIKKERHVLVIFPHPDDEAFGVFRHDFYISKNGGTCHLRMLNPW